MKVIRRSGQPHQLTNSRPAFPRNIYFFYEKNTGVSHFHVEAGPDGGFPVDQAAGLLAMHCMVRGQSPSDYVVMVQAEEEALKVSAKKRLRCCRQETPYTASSNSRVGKKKCFPD